MSGTFLTDCP